MALQAPVASAPVEVSQVSFIEHSVAPLVVQTAQFPLVAHFMPAPFPPLQGVGSVLPVH